MTEQWDAEKVYDEKIAPLMDQIIAVCKAHEIPILAVFQYTEDAQFVTTSLGYDKANEALKEMMDRWAVKRKGAACIAETHITNPDGSKTIQMRVVR